MLYKTIGYVAWTGGKWYVKRRVGGTLKVAAGLAVVTVAATAYLVAHNGGDDQP